MNVRSRSSKNLVSKIHERALNLISEINDIPFNELFSIDNEISIHNKNIQTLLIEVYRNLDGLSALTMLDFFTTLQDKYII